MSRPVVLINANTMRPPVAPLALDYIGGRLRASGVPVRLVDLSFADDSGAALARALGDEEPIAVGISFRNTDDCFWPGGAWFLPQHRELTAAVRAATSAPIVLGGCGFSIFPTQFLDACGLDLAVVGDGEDAFLQLVRCIEAGADYRSVPGLAHRGPDGTIVVNHAGYGSKLDLPVDRRTVDNSRYLREGAMGNIETKRGCPGRCIYCADPVAKGSAARCRPARQVADEIEVLLGQGVDVLHFCDSEFNIPPDHAMAVCEEIINRRLGDRLRWYCYASVHPFPDALAPAMRRAGCVGINFGVDSGCDRMLAALGRGYRATAVHRTTDACRLAGIIVMLDLLIGAPGEDEASVRETIDFVKAVGPERAGAATGVRVYPGTPLAETVRQQGPMADNPNLRGCVEGNDDFFRPVFYVDRRLGDDPTRLVADLIAGDDRFFPPAGVSDDAGYNYNDHAVLTQAIAAGRRGAFWDILGQLAPRDEDRPA